MDLRLDRLATLYVVSPLMRLASEKQVSIPILMYHSISEEDESRLHAYYRIATSPAEFAAQMEYLHQCGYKTCSLAEGIAQLETPTESAAKSVVITFDDGFRNIHQSAFPLLNQFGFTATVFLPTAYIGERPLLFQRKECLTWSEVRELQKYGISFGSHSVTHPQLFGLDADAIQLEIENSKKSIEEKTGCAVDSFSYPYAFPQTNSEFKGRFRNSLLCAGYKNGVSTVVGRAGRGSDRFFMERLPMNSLDDRALFQAKLTGAYDWISKSQTIVKTVKSHIGRICGQG